MSKVILKIFKKREKRDDSLGDTEKMESAYSAPMKRDPVGIKEFCSPTPCTVE